jgi:dipeptide/tripeptide permease
MQKKTHSLIEAFTNTFIGLLLNMSINHYLLFPILGVEVGWGGSFAIASFFVVVSIIRGYTVRRLFNSSIITKERRKL